MTSKDLVTSALQGKLTSRVPIGPLAVHFCATFAGRSLESYTTDPKVMADSVLRYYERFKPDAIWISADTWVSAQAMGVQVHSTGPNQPWGGNGHAVVSSVADIDRIPPPDVGGQGRYPLMLEALSRVVSALGREVFVVACFDQYPFSLAAALMGLDQALVRVLEDPPFIEALMHRCEEYAWAYACALGAAGADMLSGGDSPAGLIRPELYRELILPAEQRLIRRIKQVNDKPVSLHICGTAQALLPYMKSSGADVLEVDQQVDVETACRTVGPEIGLWGNLDPVRVLANGSPREVAGAVRKVLAAVKACEHRRFVLSSGCTLALETPEENLDALRQSSLEF